MDIVKFLDRKKLSQTELAKMLGATPQNVNRWASGEGFPGYEMCAGLIKLGATTEEIFGIASDTPVNHVDTDAEFKRRVRAALIEIING